MIGLRWCIKYHCGVIFNKHYGALGGIADRTQIAHHSELTPPPRIVVTQKKLARIGQLGVGFRKERRGGGPKGPPPFLWKNTRKEWNGALAHHACARPPPPRIVLIRIRVRVQPIPLPPGPMRRPGLGVGREGREVPVVDGVLGVLHRREGPGGAIPQSPPPTPQGQGWGAIGRKQVPGGGKLIMNYRGGLKIRWGEKFSGKKTYEIWVYILPPF